MRFLLMLLTIFVIDVEAQNLEKSRSVWVEQGLVRGKIYKIGEQQVQIFRGIPYAEPPIGDLRYKMPMRKQRWEKEFAAVDYGPPCVQFMDFHKNDRFSGPNMPHESEDCLYLNIFSPYDSEDESKLYPIIVWIHGGSFLAGSADTGIDMEAVAKNLVFKGVTLVTINYRLGPFGFMSIDYGDHVEGNFGIYDQKLALEWIQRNIKQFNGDPGSVSVMGESAGASAISVLGLSPLTRGLVHQVIALSGSATAGWAIHRHGTNAWDMKNIADYIRCNKIIPEQDLKAVLNRESITAKTKTTEHCNLQLHVPECLLNTGKMDPKDMLECFRKEVNFSEPLFRHALSAELGVSKMVVDGELIPASGIELVSDYAHLPLLTGVASREWAHKRPEFYEFWRYENMSRSKAEEAVKKLVYTSYASRLPGKVPNATLNLISNATFLRYMQDVDFNFDMPGVVARLQDLEADIEFVAPCQSEVDSYAKNGLDVFVYSFDYIPKGNIVEVDKRFYELFGDNQVTVTKKDASSDGYEITAFHGLDHAFIFSHGYSSNFQIKPFTKQDRAMSKVLTTMITNFAKSGDPSIEVFEWPAYTNSSAHYVSIGLHPKLIKGQLHFPAPEFWNHEAAMLAKYTLSESPLSDEEVSELTVEERKQLNAYRRAWWALWLFVIAVAVIIWVAIIFFVIKKGKSPTSKPYDNIVVNRE